MWGERLAADPSPEGWGSWAGTLIKEKRKTSEEEDFRRRRLQKKAVVMNLTGVLGRGNKGTQLEPPQRGATDEPQGTVDPLLCLTQVWIISGDDGRAG